MNDLHRDLLTEGIPDFEQSLLKTTVSAARRTRRLRYAIRSGAALAVLVCAVLLWLPLNKKPDLASRPQIIDRAPPAPQPLSHLVTIRTGQFPGVVRTKPLRADQRLISTSGLIAVLHTSDFKPEVQKIDDEQLFSLFEGQTVALVGRGPNAKLVFLEDTETR